MHTTISFIAIRNILVHGIANKQHLLVELLVHENRIDVLNACVTHWRVKKLVSTQVWVQREREEPTEAFLWLTTKYTANERKSFDVFRPMICLSFPDGCLFASSLVFVREFFNMHYQIKGFIFVIIIYLFIKKRIATFLMWPCISVFRNHAITKSLIEHT